MQVLTSDDLLVSTGQWKEALEQELCFLLAVKLFELRQGCATMLDAKIDFYGRNGSHVHTGYQS